ncbi:hypothetical protein BDN71DRAFT_1448706 [Pleurotus eryngii]|uniref:Uncharacterized protein n=1 Tax=Pleurotus eryngii TaxID=5323 RepID=A0A9P5ZVK1_PLEER|nr:hypothetical protein BDN71DRAFT_1448706 [Pleurotus eryngii]
MIQYSTSNAVTTPNHEQTNQSASRPLIPQRRPSTTTDRLCLRVAREYCRRRKRGRLDSIYNEDNVSASK